MKGDFQNGNEATFQAGEIVYSETEDKKIAMTSRTCSELKKASNCHLT